MWISADGTLRVRNGTILFSVEIVALQEPCGKSLVFGHFSLSRRSISLFSLVGQFMQLFKK